MIETRIHKVSALLDDCEPGKQMQLTRDIIDAQLPHYILTNELLDALTMTDACATAAALYNADAMHLPFTDCVVEHQTSTITNNGPRPATAFVLISESDSLPGEFAGYAFFLCDDCVWCMPSALQFGVRQSTQPRDDSNLYGIEFRLNLDRVRHKDGQPDPFDSLVLHDFLRLVTLTHTRGVAKRETTERDLAKLNKARAKSGKPQITPYTVLHITKSTATAANGSRSWHEGVKMRPHLRAGHTRNQVCGVGRAERKIVFVPPCLVNCESANDLPQRTRVVKP